VVSGYIEDRNRPVFKQVHGCAAETNVAREHQHINTVRRSNQAFARELPVKKFEVKVGRKLDAHFAGRSVNRTVNDAVHLGKTCQV
jgi:hypothetical protein